jgi:hypothetical protein
VLYYVMKLIAGLSKKPSPGTQGSDIWVKDMEALPFGKSPARIFIFAILRYPLRTP